MPGICKPQGERGSETRQGTQHRMLAGAARQGQPGRDPREGAGKAESKGTKDQKGLETQAGDRTALLGSSDGDQSRGQRTYEEAESGERPRRPREKPKDAHSIRSLPSSGR